MKKLVATLALLCAISIAGITGMGDEGDLCADCWHDGNFSAGTNLTLDGTWTPDVDLSTYGDGAVRTISYTWQLYNLSSCDTSDDTYAWEFRDGTTFSDPVINFSAPAVPGCYIIKLTVDHMIKVYEINDTNEPDLTKSAILVLDEPCVDYDCYTFCVDPYACVSCSGIFCDTNCSEYWNVTGATTECQDYDIYGDGLCYPDTPSPSSITVEWYVVVNDTLLDSSATDSEVEAYILGATQYTADCFKPDPNGAYSWCSPYDEGIYQIIMVVRGYDDEGTPIITNWCPVGTVVIVEDPEVSIV